MNGGPEHAPRPRRPGLWLLLVGAGLLAFAFGPRLGGEYVWDDVYLVAENPDLADAAGLRRLLTTHLWRSANHDLGQLYHPLPMATLWLQVQLAGRSLPFLRLANVLSHLGCAALLFLLLGRQRLPRPVALAGALVFLVHPSVTEPVMWITGRHDTLGVLALLGALLLWPDGGRHVLARAFGSALLAGAAVLCKEPYVVGPALLALAAVLPPTRGDGDDRGPRWPARVGLLALPVAAVLGVFGLRHALGIPSSTDMLGARPLAHVVAFGTIVWHYFVQLATLGNGPTAAAFRLLSPAAALGVLAAFGLAVAASVLALRRGSRHAAGVLLGLAWFALALSPHVLTMPLTGLFANRYGYFPLCGLVLTGAHLVAAANDRVTPRLRRVALGAAAIVVVALTLRTAAEARPWADPVSLWGADFAADPTNGIALTHYGYALSRRGGCAAALPSFRRATELSPSYDRAWHNLAGCLVTVGRYAEAVAPARRALAWQPGSSRSEYNLGAALLLSGRREEGLRHLARCRELEPSYLPAASLVAAAGPGPASAPASAAAP